MEASKVTTETSDLQCGVCSRVFDRRSRLDAHYKTHTGERPFTCPFCGKNFASKGNCNTHMRVHTRERPYQCPHCEKRFSQHGQLVIHIRRHTGEKPYICPHCNKGFTCSKVLKIHVRTHTGEKPFQCEYCHKGFAAYANLVVHRRIHTRERPYSCHLCGRAFEHSGNLSRHVRVHRVDNGVRCIPCGQVFSCDQDLVTHTAHVHPNEHAREEETELEDGSPTESTINMHEFKQFQPPHGIQSLPPPSCEPQLTMLTPMAPPVSMPSVSASLPQSTEPTEELRDSGACITLSDSEDSGRESSGSTGYSASPDQPYDRLSNQLPETSVKTEKTEVLSQEVKTRIMSHGSSCESPRETLTTSVSSGTTLCTPSIRMPPKKQQYPGGSRSPLTVLQAALSSQKQTIPTLAQPIVSQCSVSHITNLTPPTVSLPNEPTIQPDTSAPNSPQLNIQQLSLSQKSTSTSLTPVGLSAAPQAQPYVSQLTTDQSRRDSSSNLSPLYGGHISPQSQNATEANPLDLSQPINSQHSTPLNLSQRLEVQTSGTVGSCLGNSSNVLPHLSTPHLLSSVPSIEHPSHHLLTAAVPSTPTSRANILRRKSADVGHSEVKRNKTRKVAPPPLIPINSPEDQPAQNLSVTSESQPIANSVFQPSSPTGIAAITTANAQSTFCETMSSTTIPPSYTAPVINMSDSSSLTSSNYVSISSSIPTTVSSLSYIHSSPSLSIPPPPSHTHHPPTVQPLHHHTPNPLLPFLPHSPLSSAIPSPPSKQEDTTPDIIIESDVQKDKLLISPKKFPETLQRFNTGIPSPIECMRENIQRSLMSLLPAGHEATGFKRKVETALVVLVGDAPMKQMGYPEKTAEQVLITILDMAGKSPCADVRVDEQQRLKINMRKFLEYGFPSQKTWEDLGWNGCSIETIMDNIITWISRRQNVDSKLVLGVGGATGAGTVSGVGGPPGGSANSELFGGGGSGGGAGEEFKVNGAPLKAS